MRAFKIYSIVFGLLVPCILGAQIPYTVIAYHDVVNKKSELTGDAITAEELINHFEWLKENGYHPISLQQIISGAKLPPKAVLLSFDDGYVSVYTKVYPLLKLYKYPAIIALVGSYIESNLDSVQYGNNGKKARTDFLRWEQIKEMQSSGLVEVASHTYDLHKEIRSNLQGNTNPAAVTFLYDTIRKIIETEVEYIQRIEADFKKNNALFLQELKEIPKAIVWPYGRYNDIVQEIASRNGLPVSINLNTYANYGTELHFNINRYYITRNATVDALRDYLENKKRINYYRSLQVPVSSFKDLPGDIAEPNFSKFLSEISASTANAIIIPTLYTLHDTLFAIFKNPLVNSINTQLNRVIWQSQIRIQTDVYLLWEEALIDRALSTKEQKRVFFSAMGRVAPARGVLINSDSLVSYFKVSSSQVSLKEKNNDLLRINRQKLLSTNANNLPDIFYFLETFQRYQVDMSALLKLSAKNAYLLNDSAFVKEVFTYFNGVVLDLSQQQAIEAAATIQSIQYLPIHFSRVAVQLPLVSRKNFDELNTILVRKKIMSFGFVINDLDELAKYRLPANTRKVKSE